MCRPRKASPSLSTCSRHWRCFSCTSLNPTVIWVGLRSESLTGSISGSWLVIERSSMRGPQIGDDRGAVLWVLDHEIHAGARREGLGVLQEVVQPGRAP